MTITFYDSWVSGSSRASTADIADVIDQAVEHLERNPWGQGNGRYSSEHAICGEDAVWMAALNLQTIEDLRAVVTQTSFRNERDYLGYATTAAIARHVSAVDRLWQWNDAPGRTKQEVIDALKETAKELRNQATVS